MKRFFAFAAILALMALTSAKIRFEARNLRVGDAAACFSMTKTAAHDLEIYVPAGKVAVEGASSLLPLRDNVYTVAVRFGEESEPYVTQTVKISRLP